VISQNFRGVKNHRKFSKKKIFQRFGTLDFQNLRKKNIFQNFRLKKYF